MATNLLSTTPIQQRYSSPSPTLEYPSSSSQSQWRSSSSSTEESSSSSSLSRKKSAPVNVTHTVKELQKQVKTLSQQMESAVTSKKPVFEHLDTFAKLDISARNIIQQSAALPLAQVKELVKPIVDARTMMVMVGLGVTKNESAGMFLIRLATELHTNPKALENSENAKRLGNRYDHALADALGNVRARLGERREKESADPSSFSFSSSSFTTHSFTLEESSDPLYDNSISPAAKAQVLWEVGVELDQLSERDSAQAAGIAKLAKDVSGAAKKGLSKEKSGKAKEASPDTSDLLENLRKLKGGTGSSTRSETEVSREKDSSEPKGKKGASKKEEASNTDDLLESLKRLKGETSSSTRRKDSSDEGSSSSSREYGKSAKTAKKDKDDNTEDLLSSLRALKGEGSKIGSTRGETHRKLSKEARGLKETIRKLAAEEGRLKIECQKIEKGLGILGTKLQSVGLKLNDLRTQDISTDVYKKAKITGAPEETLQQFIQLMNKGKGFAAKLNDVQAKLEEARFKLESAERDTPRDLSELENKPLERRHTRIAREAVEEVQKRAEELESKIKELMSNIEGVEQALKTAKEEIEFYTDGVRINEQARAEAYHQLSELRGTALKTGTELASHALKKPVISDSSFGDWNARNQELAQDDNNAKQQVLEANNEYQKAVKQHNESSSKLKASSEASDKFKRQLLVMQRELDQLNGQLKSAQERMSKLSGQTSSLEEVSTERMPEVNLEELAKSRKGEEFRALIELLKVCYDPHFHKEKVDQAGVLMGLYNKCSEKHQALIGKILLAKAKDKEGSDHMDYWMQAHIADNIVALVKACVACFRSK